MKRKIKRILLFMAGIFGILHLLRYINRNKIVIFMLHGIVEDKEYSWETIRKQCSLGRFENVLKVLRRYFEFISMEDAVQMLSGKVPLRPYCAVLTFDDGYRNNYELALPVLEKYNIPAIYFISTGNIDSQKPHWFDMMDYVIQHNSRSIKMEVGGKIYTFENDDNERLAKEFRRFLFDCNNSQGEDDIELISKIYAIIKKWEIKEGKNVKEILNGDSRTAMMSWKHVGILSSKGIEIGSHTVDHCRLGTIAKDEIYRQLEKSKMDIEKHLGKACKYLSYPNGSYNEKVIDIAKVCGYSASVTTKSGLNGISEDTFRLNRISFPIRDDKSHILYHIYRNFQGR